MCKVEQIVGEQRDIGGEILITGLRAPFRVLHRKRVRDQPLVCLGALTHPDPYPSGTLPRRVCFDSGPGGYARLARYFHTRTARIESQTMVHAADAVAF